MVACGIHVHCFGPHNNSLTYFRNFTNTCQANFLILILFYLYVVVLSKEIMRRLAGPLAGQVCTLKKKKKNFVHTILSGMEKYDQPYLTELFKERMRTY